MDNDKYILCDTHQVGIGNAEKVKRAPHEPEVREGRLRFFPTHRHWLQTQNARMPQLQPCFA